MKWNVRDFQNNLRRGASSGHGSKILPSIVLFYGEDGGAVRRYTKQACKAVVDDIDDPFLCDRISAEDLSQNPSILCDAAGSIPLGGDTKLVRLEGVNGDVSPHVIRDVTEALKLCIHAPQNSSTIVISASGLDNKNALIKCVEKDINSVAIACYPDNSQSLGGLVNAYFEQKSVTIAPDAVIFLQENLGNNRDITYRELEKLYSYLGSEKNLTVEHCLASISSAPSVNVFKLCDAIGARDIVLAEKHLRILQEEGVDLTSINAMALRHLRRLLQAKELVNSGLMPDMALSKLSPPVFYGKSEFINQFNSYPLSRLRNVTERFYQAQVQSRQGYAFSSTVLERNIIAAAL